MLHRRLVRLFSTIGFRLSYVGGCLCSVCFADEILHGMTTWNGVTMGPIEKVYEKPPEGEPIKPDEDMMVGDEDTPMEAEA